MDCQFPHPNPTVGEIVCAKLFSKTISEAEYISPADSNIADGPWHVVKSVETGRIYTVHNNDIGKKVVQSASPGSGGGRRRKSRQTQRKKSRRSKRGRSHRR